MIVMSKQQVKDTMNSAPTVVKTIFFIQHKMIEKLEKQRRYWTITGFVLGSLLTQAYYIYG